MAVYAMKLCPSCRCALDSYHAANGCGTVDEHQARDREAARERDDTEGAWQAYLDAAADLRAAQGGE